MKKVLYFALVAGMVAGAQIASAAESAEAILKKHVAAIGGEGAFQKAKSRSMTGVLDIPAQGLSANMKILAKAPNMMRSEIDIPGMGKVVEGTDGKTAWTQSPFMGVIDKEGGQLDQAKKQADFYRDVEIADRYETWTSKGKEKVEGKDAFVLVGSSADGDSETLYIDSSNYLLLKTSSQVDTPNGKMDASTVLSDYKSIDGMQIPHSIKILSPMGDITMKVNEVKLNVDLPDSLFAKPTQ